ncbi:MAG: hypothetical protein AAGH15_08100 [Myxococcota bacterium]
MRPGHAAAVFAAVALLGCFASRSDELPMDLGAADPDACEGVCFEWLPRDEWWQPGPRCGTYSLGTGCPEGFACQADGPPWLGSCRPTGPDLPELVFDLGPQRPPMGGARVTLQLRVNGRPFSRAGRPGPSSFAFLVFQPVDAPRSGYRVALDGPTAELRLPAGTYVVTHDTELGLDDEGNVPPPGRRGRLVVRGDGEATIDWQVPEIDWTLRVDGVLDAETRLYFQAEQQINPIVSGPETGRVLLEPGSYEVSVRRLVDPTITTPGGASLGRLEVTGSRRVAFALDTVPFSGRITVDGEPAPTGFVLFRNEWTRDARFPVDATNGRFRGRLIEGRYERIAVAPDAISVARLDTLSSAMDIDATTVNVAGRVTLDGEPLPAGFDPPLRLLFAPDGYGPGTPSVPGPDGAFTVRLVRGESYAVRGIDAAGVLGRGVRVDYAFPERVVVVDDADLALDIPLARIAVRATLDGLPPSVNRSGGSRGRLILRRATEDGAGSVTQVLELSGGLPGVANGEVLGGRYDVWLSRDSTFVDAVGEAFLGTVDVGAEDDVSFSFDTSTRRIAGRISVRGAPPRASSPGTYGRVAISPAGATAERPFAPVAADGSFELEVFPGTFGLSYRCVAEEGCDQGLGDANSQGLVSLLEVPPES